MNAYRLWDTTLNHETRILLQVNISYCEVENAVFLTLMGDVVEPRLDSTTIML